MPVFNNPTEVKCYKLACYMKWRLRNKRSTLTEKRLTRAEIKKELADMPKEEKIITTKRLNEILRLK